MLLRCHMFAADAFASRYVAHAVEAVNASTSKFQAAVARAEAGGLVPGEAVFRAAEKLGASTRPLYTQLLLPVAQLEDGELQGLSVGTHPGSSPLGASPHNSHFHSPLAPFSHYPPSFLPTTLLQASASWSRCGGTSSL